MLEVTVVSKTVTLSQGNQKPQPCSVVEKEEIYQKKHCNKNLGVDMYVCAYLCIKGEEQMTEKEERKPADCPY